MHFKQSVGTSVLVGLTVVSAMVASGSASADGRTWSKYVQSVEENTGTSTVKFADFVVITTSDQQLPMLERTLFADDQGHRLVARHEYHGEDGLATTVIESLSGETLSIEVDQDHNTTVRAGSEQVTVTYADVAAQLDIPALPADKQGPALALLDQLSPSFQAALRRFTEIGIYDSVQFYVPASLLAVFFFRDIDPVMPIKDETVPPHHKVVGFDPQTSPPNEFEQLFGDAYYE